MTCITKRIRVTRLHMAVNKSTLFCGASSQVEPLRCCSVVRSWTAKAFKRSAISVGACPRFASHEVCARRMLSMACVMCTATC